MVKRQRKLWSAESIEYLINSYDKVPKDQIVAILQHPYGSIRAKARQLKIIKPKKLITKIIGEQHVRELYWQEGKSSAEIAMMFGYDGRVIRNFMKCHNIPRRTPIAGRLLAIKQGRVKYPTGSEHWAWKGGRMVEKDGYIRIYKPDHPRGKRKGYVAEHILVWEQVHNCFLPKGWVIHHLNGIKTDNRPENLIAMKRSEHTNQVKPYKKRIRELEAKVKFLEKVLDTQQLIWWSEN